MSTSQETELKLIVNESGYRILGEHFPIIKVKKQTNFYFDTNDFILSKANATLRIRIEDAAVKLTFKAQIRYVDTILREAMEYDVELDKKEYSTIINNPENIVNYFSADMTRAFKHVYQQEKPLVLLGNIENTRTYIEGYQNTVFELDKSILPNDIILYELEIENISFELANQVMNHLEEIGVTFKINNRSKYNRFLNMIYNV